MDKKTEITPEMVDEIAMMIADLDVSDDLARVFAKRLINRVLEMVRA